MGERKKLQASQVVLRQVKKHAGGRLPKYSESCRPITVTLPERILQDLHSINPDRSKAIVKCVEAIVTKGDRQFKPVELIELTLGKALILVGHSPSLQQIEWLRLVEIAPFRYLLVLPSGMAVEVLEVTIQDLLKDLDPNSSESALLKELLDVISHQRRGQSITKAELLFIDIQEVYKQPEISGSPKMPSPSQTAEHRIPGTSRAARGLALRPERECR